MNRTNRLALLGAATLVLLAAGTALAIRTPAADGQPSHVASSHEPQADAPATAEELAHAADRLAARDLAIDEAVLADLASRYGLGGAVRLVAWADAAGEDIETIAAMRDGDATTPGMGWGQIARELGVSPGIGSIMGNGGGLGREHAPGQLKEHSGEGGE